MPFNLTAPVQFNVLNVCAVFLAQSPAPIDVKGERGERGERQGRLPDAHEQRIIDKMNEHSVGRDGR